MQKIIFNNAVYSDGLGFEFGREGSTVNDLGEPIAHNIPRYAKPQALVDQLKATDFVVQSTIANSAGVSWTDVGFDKDYSTLLAIFFGADSSLRFFRGNLVTPINTRTVASFNRTVRTGVTKSDLLTGVAGADTTVYHEYYGTAVTFWNVIPGCILGFANQKLSADDSTTGNATIIAWHEGSGWGNSDGLSIIGTVNSLVSGVAGGNKWSFTGYYAEDSTTPPLKLWIVGTDYKASPPGGGSVTFIFLATRASATDDWTFGPVKSINNANATHGHSAGLVFGRDSGGVVNRLELITAVGDSSPGTHVSYLTRHYCDDPANYSTATWTAQLDFFGSYGPKNGTAVYADQPVALLPGPDDRSLVMASDLWNYSVTRLDVPTSTSAKGSFTAQWGWIHGWDGLYLKCGDPIRRKHYLHVASIVADTKYKRIIYSEDGRVWNPVTIPPDGAFDNQLFHNQLIRHKTSEISISKAVEVQTRRPLQIGPGGTNRLMIAPLNPLNYASVVTGSYGAWNWPYDVAEPPTKSTPYYIDAPSGNRASVGYSHGHIDSFSITGMHMMPGTACMRWYFNARPGFGCNMTLHTGSPAYLGALSGGRFSQNHEWQGYANSVTPTDTNIYTNRYVIYIGETDNVYPYQGLAVPAVIYDNRDAFIGWNVGAGATGGNERFKITGIETNSTWSCYAYLQIPHHSWIFPSGGSVQTQVPLFTLYGNATNHVYVYADLATHGIKAQVTSNNVVTGTLSCNISATRMFNEGEELRIQITKSATNIDLRIAIAGDVFNATTLVSGLAVDPVEIRSGKPAFQEYVYSDAGNANYFGFAIGDDSGLDLTDGEIVAITEEALQSSVSIAIGIGL